MKKVILTIISLFTGYNFITVFAQKPYFQQEVNYTISVFLNDAEHTLSAFETLEYINNSPDTLSYIYFHLWPNAYKNNQTAYAVQNLENSDNKFYYSSPEEKGFIDSLNFLVNSEKIQWTFDDMYIDICKLKLNNLLKPHEKITISTPFRVKIPGRFSRFGHVDQSYQITQWYPKPAVYDREGWHAIPYLDQGEFYSEFGSYDVSITLPKDYVVAATGELQTPSEVEWLNYKVNLLKGDSVNRLLSDSAELKTIRFTENNVHDFAWFADKKYFVAKDSVQLPNSGKQVITWAFYKEEDSKTWNKANEYINDALLYYSKWYGDYPYRNCTAVRGAIEAGGAMEYPEITVVGASGTDLLLETMIMHEVGHNWFYGVLGFNERDYPYLDEGLNTFSDFRYINEKYERKKKAYELYVPEIFAKFLNLSDLPFSSNYELSSLMPQRANIDQPLNSASADFVYMSYGSIVYHKSAFAYYYLMNSMGEAAFDSVMQSFYQFWKFKHPQPDDLRSAFENASEKDLSWFFDDLISTTKRVDYKAVNIKENKICIKNTGAITSPVSVTGYLNGEKQYSLWEQGFEQSKWIDLPQQPVDKVVLNEGEIPDFHRKDNTIKTSGIFKKLEPLEINKSQIFEKPDKTQLGAFPAVGWNYYNGLMLGALFYSPAAPFQRFEYQLVPMYAFENNNFAGMGKLTLHTLPDFKLTNRIDISLSALQFGGDANEMANFNKMRGEIKVFIRKKNTRSFFSQRIEMAATSIGSELSGRTQFYNLHYKLNNRNILNPFNIHINAEMADNSPRVSMEINFLKALKYSERAFSIRLFAGYILSNDNIHPFYLSGGSKADYQYDEIYPARFEDYASKGIISYQSSENHGAFAVYTPFYSTKWLATAQLKLKIPKIPVNVYASAGTYSEAGDNFEIESDYIKSNKIPYEAGFDVAIDDFMHVYFPVFLSSDIEYFINDMTEKYLQRVRFSIDFNKLNLFNLRDKLLE